MWAVHLRLHDASWRTGLPFFGAAALVLAGTPLPFSELLAGAVLAALVVVETRLAAAAPRRREHAGEPGRGPGSSAGLAVRGQQPPQPVGQARPAGSVEPGEQLVLGVEQVDQRAVDGRPTLGRQLDADRAAVVRVAVAADEAATRRAGRRGWSWSPR